MKKKIIIISLIIAILGLGFLGYEIYKGNIDIPFLSTKNNKDTPKDTNKDNDADKEKPEEPVVVKKLKIINQDSNTRSIGIMVDNEKGAWPQAGLQEAYIVYEIIVEGGETRFFALYKDATTAMIGPCRSTRHYFVDYAMENDAILTHYGFSPQAMTAIKNYGINNLSGTQGDNSAFWREKPLGGWHNVFTSISNLNVRIAAHGYRTTTTTDTLLNYSVDDVDLTKKANARVANSIYIQYSWLHNVSYEYDSVNKVYKRSQRKAVHTDRVTGLQLTFKNIIIINVKNSNLNDYVGSSRQTLSNIGSGTGYYITNGYSEPITWTKDANASQTIYKDLYGNEINVSDGNTIIQIQPLNKTLTIN